MHRIVPGVIVLIYCMLPGEAVAAGAGTRQRTFLRALEVFDAAKSPREYRESATLLESLLADGFRNGAVYKNMGNAYFRAGEYGRAIAAYRKAKPYRPRDSYLEANLRQALSAAPGHLPEPPPPWWTHVLFWSGLLSFPEKAYATSGRYRGDGGGGSPPSTGVVDQRGARDRGRRAEYRRRVGLWRHHLVAAWRCHHRDDRPERDRQGL
jgi:tetratricopeptide (TPR) repeat protein